jgi:hypothetical protein
MQKTTRKTKKKRNKKPKFPLALMGLAQRLVPSGGPDGQGRIER